jgi:hypothetical protein
MQCTESECAEALFEVDLGGLVADIVRAAWPAWSMRQATFQTWENQEEGDQLMGHADSMCGRGSMEKGKWKHELREKEALIAAKLRHRKPLDLCHRALLSSASKKHPRHQQPYQLPSRANPYDSSRAHFSVRL